MAGDSSVGLPEQPSQGGQDKYTELDNPRDREWVQSICWFSVVFLDIPKL